MIESGDATESFQGRDTAKGTTWKQGKRKSSDSGFRVLLVEFLLYGRPMEYWKLWARFVYSSGKKIKARDGRKFLRRGLEHSFQA